jgi:uncharacterized protein (TIRG00374 family)
MTDERPIPSKQRRIRRFHRTRKAFDWKFWIGMGISGLFLFLAVRNVDFREVGRAFAGANYWYLIPSAVANLTGLWIRSLRWGVLLRPVRTVRMRDLFPCTVIGFMANNLFPARLGEFMRAIVLKRRTGIPASAAFATIVLERMFDGVTILLVLLVIVGFLDLPFPDWLRKASFASIVGFLALLGFLVTLKLHTDKALRLFRAVLRPVPERWRDRLLRLLQSFVDGLQMLHDWRSLVMSIVLSAGLWIFPALAIYFALLASGLFLPLSAAFFLLVVVVMGVIAPSAPGYVGTIQYMAVIGLALFGVPKSTALGFSILYHLTQYIPVTALGLVLFFSMGLSFSKIRETERLDG